MADSLLEKALTILSENGIQQNDKTVHKFTTVIKDHPQLNEADFVEAMKSAKGRKYESNNKTLRKIISILYSKGVGYPYEAKMSEIENAIWRAKVEVAQDIYETHATSVKALRYYIQNKYLLEHTESKSSSSLPK